MTRHWLRIALTLLCLFACLMSSFLPVSAKTKEPDEPKNLTCTACAVYNVDTGVTMYEKNAGQALYPAATVKLMTGILCYEYYCDKMDTPITITSDALAYGSGGYSIKLKLDEVITARSLLYAMVLYNANDAASALAFSVAGSVPNFVRMMNEKAAQLGCTDTFFTNPTGMDDDQMHSTVSDLVKIAAYTAKNSGYTAITSMQSATLPATNLSEARDIFNRNHMVSAYLYKTKYFNSLAKGLLAGATNKGGYCGVHLVTWYGDSYLTVVMNAKYDEETDTNYVYSDAEKLLDWAYDQYGYVKVADTKTMICELPVTMSRSSDHISLVPEDTVELFLPNDTDVSKDVEVSWRLFGDSIEAPVYKGEIAGILTVKYKGDVVRTMKLVAKSDLPESSFLRLFSALGTIVLHPLFILAVILMIFASVWIVLRTAKKRGQRLHRHRSRQIDDN